MKWISVKDSVPEKGSFLAYWENQPPLMLVCFVNAHKMYIISGSNNDSCGHGKQTKFSHWMPLPEPPTTKIENK